MVWLHDLYLFAKKFFLVCERWFDSPPFVGANVTAAGEPWVEDEDAPECFTSADPSQQGWVVRQSEALAEPVHSVLLSRALPRHLVTGDVLRHHAGSVHLELEGGEAVQMISRKDTQGTAGDSASAPSVHGCSFLLSHWSVRFATASFPGLLLVERLTLPRWTSRWLTAARQYSWCRL